MFVKILGMAQANWEKVIIKNMPAMVSIVISKSLENVEKEIPRELLPLFPFLNPKKQLEQMTDAHGMIKVGSGSGFIVSPKGIILTNKHVVADAKSDYTVITNDNKKYKATILARDPIEDVAILKITGRRLPVVGLGDSDDIALGQPVLAIGTALGLFKNTVSSGIISGLSRAIAAAAAPNTPMQELRGLIQTDAAVNPGNSGGPLINAKGQVIGINTAIVFGAQNLSFAIPINTAKRDLSDLNKFGRIKRPLLGLRYVMVDENLQAKMKLPVDYGALVLGHSTKEPAIIPGSPAAKAGLKEKDIVLECNGEKVTKEKTIQDFLEEKGVGDYILLKVRRGSREFEKKALLAERK